MPTPEHWKTYEPIDDVPSFDSAGVGPSFERISVTANCSPNQMYPECRIAVHLGRLGSGALTVEQSAELRARLEAAERDVRAGSDLGKERSDG